MFDVGSRFVFLGYVDAVNQDDATFKAGDFGVVAALDEGALVCLLTDYDGNAVWPFPETLFPEEVIHLTYVASVERSRIPLPYGDMIGEPHKPSRCER